ncbi:unnamed protein product, partial [Protopolystoma xenopodis]
MLSVPVHRTKMAHPLAYIKKYDTEVLSSGDMNGRRKLLPQRGHLAIPRQHNFHPSLLHLDIVNLAGIVADMPSREDFMATEQLQVWLHGVEAGGVLGLGPGVWNKREMETRREKNATKEEDDARVRRAERIEEVLARVRRMTAFDVYLNRVAQIISSPGGGGGAGGLSF